EHATREAIRDHRRAIQFRVLGPRQPGCRRTTPHALRRARSHRARQGAPRRQASDVAMKREHIFELFRRLRELNPHPATELDWKTPFELLVAVILSAQATDVGVNKATRKLFPVANTPQAILDLGEDG